MTLDTSTIQGHYQRATPVYEALATVQEYPTIGLNDFIGWYIKRDHGDVEAIEAGYPQRGRVTRLDRDYEEICNRLERTLYAVTTYKTPEAFQRWEPCRYDAGEGTTVWRDEPPTPEYADLRAVPAWGDIDLADDLKPARGELDDETRTLVENTLTAYIEEYAELYGAQDAVYALDSVGGAYIFGAPEATLPIAKRFSDDPDALERVFDEFLDRSNEWLQRAEERVNDRIDGAGDVIHPDWVNNKNRQFKPPLGLHADHDAVVTPLDPYDLQYNLLPFDAVDSDAIQRATAWAETFTRVEHTDCVSSLVATLWPNLYDEHDGWRTTLDAWLGAERERERERRRQREQALRRRQKRLEEIGNSLDGQPITPFKQDVYEAVDAVAITEIARHYASDAYDTDPNQPRPQFDPSWRHSESGRSCFVVEPSNTFGDSKVNGGGGPAKLMALATGIITDAQENLDGEAYWAAVDELRNAGYAIPVWVPEVGTKGIDGDPYDQMPFWAVKKAAVALGVCSQDAFIDRDSEDGTYEGFPDYETYNAALEAIAQTGLNHGRDPVTPELEYGQDESTLQSTATPKSSPDLDGAHLREKNRLLERKVERLTQTINKQAETIEHLKQENESLRRQLEIEQENRQQQERHRAEVTLGDYGETQSGDLDKSDDAESNDAASPLTRMRRFVSFRE